MLPDWSPRCSAPITSHSRKGIGFSTLDGSVHDRTPCRNRLVNQRIQEAVDFVVDVILFFFGEFIPLCVESIAIVNVLHHPGAAILVDVFEHWFPPQYFLLGRTLN